MASYVLDTHACVFVMAAPRKLGRKARAALKRVEEGREEAWIPAAVVAEIIVLRELGRIGIGLPEVRSLVDDTPAIRFSHIDLGQLDQFSAITAIRDPFDRLIIACARAVGARLLTSDAMLTESGLVEVVW